MADQSPSCRMRWESCTDPTLRRSGELEVQVKTRHVAGSGRWPELEDLLHHCPSQRFRYLAEAILSHSNSLMRRMLLSVQVKKKNRSLFIQKLHWAWLYSCPSPHNSMNPSGLNPHQKTQDSVLKGYFLLSLSIFSLMSLKSSPLRSHH